MPEMHTELSIIIMFSIKSCSLPFFTLLTHTRMKASFIPI